MLIYTHIGGVDMNEVFLASLLCGLLGGADTETRQKFDNLGDTRWVRVDCETPTHVIEFAMDLTPSSRDSVHQAVFASLKTGKTPMVVMIDTDGEEGRYEQEMREVTSHLEIAYHFCRKDFLVRWYGTSPFRPAKVTLANDLPPPEIAALQCNVDFPESLGKLDTAPEAAGIASD